MHLKIDIDDFCFDSIFFIQVYVYHRIVQKKFFQNNEAKSFIVAAGFEKKNVHFCIVRKIFVYLIHFAQDIGRIFEYFSYLRYYDTLK